MRVKVTGFIETDDLPESMVDVEHEMGISDEAYLLWTSGGQNLPPLEDLEFEAVRD